jgi:hypothetical protein
MDFTQSFEEFSRGLTTTDLALYAGVGIVVWVIFGEKLKPLGQKIANSLSTATNAVKNTIPKNPVPSLSDLTLVTTPKNDDVLVSAPTVVASKDDVFFELIVSWKRTRDLALKANCEAAVKVADQMFPYLSPEVCKKGLNDE